MIKKEQENIDKEFEKILQTKESKRFAFWVLIVFFRRFHCYGLLLFPLDEGVPTKGKVVVDTKRKAIQHSTGGTIKEIYVKEGDFVEKDDILMKLERSKGTRVKFSLRKIILRALKENMNLQRISLTKVSGLIESGKKAGEVSGGGVGWYPRVGCGEDMHQRYSR